MRRLGNRLEDIWRNICEEQQRERNKTKHQNGAVRKAIPLKLCQVAMARILPIEKGIHLPRFDGPYKITKILGEWTYELTHTKTGQKIDRHVKLCLSSGEPVSQASRVHEATIEQRVPLQPSVRFKTRESLRRESRRSRFPPDRYGFSVRGEVL